VLWVEGADVIVDRYIGPVFVQDALAVEVAFHELNGSESTEPASGQ
jgi:hypothetical protein